MGREISKLALRFLTVSMYLAWHPKASFEIPDCLDASGLASQSFKKILNRTLSEKPT
jgi:hypothetical protein